MLAQRFSRMNAPVRYALDPAHAQAIYNFLKLQSRVYGIPEMMGSQENRQLLGNAHPLGMELAQQLHHGDDSAAMVLPDLMEEHGATPLGKPGGSLLFHLLSGLRSRLTANVGEVDPQIVHGYGDEGHNYYAAAHPGRMHGLSINLNNLRQMLPQGSGGRELIRHLGNAMDRGEATALPGIHDAVAKLGSPGFQQHTLNTLHHMNDFMANHAGM